MYSLFENYIISANVGELKKIICEIIKEDYMRLYNHESINKLEDIDELINIGITNFKIVLDNENKEDIKMILNALKVAKNIL